MRRLVGRPGVGSLDLNLISWNGTNLQLAAAWRHATDPVNRGYVSALLPTADGNLVVAGSFDWVDGSISAFPLCIGLWKPATQSVETLGAAFDSNLHVIHALARMPNGDLIAGGVFTTGSGGPANGVARWNGTQWLPLGSGISGAVYALTVGVNGDQ